MLLHGTERFAKSGREDGMSLELFVPRANDVDWCLQFGRAQRAQPIDLDVRTDVKLLNKLHEVRVSRAIDHQRRQTRLRETGRDVRDDEHAFSRVSVTQFSDGIVRRAQQRELILGVVVGDKQGHVNTREVRGLEVGGVVIDVDPIEALGSEHAIFCERPFRR